MGRPDGGRREPVLYRRLGQSLGEDITPAGVDEGRQPGAACTSDGVRDLNSGIGTRVDKSETLDGKRIAEGASAVPYEDSLPCFFRPEAGENRLPVLHPSMLIMDHFEGTGLFGPVVRQGNKCRWRWI